MYIKVDSLSKVYEISERQEVRSILHMVFRGASMVSSAPKKKLAVDNVSFEVKDGERIGIIGYNGAGKTTLLQIIAGLAAPSSGNVIVEGNVNCVMTLGIGLREDYTGRENIYLDGELQAKGHEYTGRVIDDIIAFADLGEFIDMPVRTYSSGMKARLAFAMIIFIEPEILIVDEALSAGDGHFGIKAAAKMKEICSKGRILLLVSHSMSAIVGMCDRCIWLDKGRVIMDGSPKEVTESYLKAVREADEEKLRQKFCHRIGNNRNSHDVTAMLDFVNAGGEVRTIFDVGDEIVARCHIATRVPIHVRDLRLTVQRTDGVPIIMTNLRDHEATGIAIEREENYAVSFTPLLLGKGIYEIRLEVIADSTLTETGKVIAEFVSILQIENNWYPYINPVTWHSADWQILEKKESVS